MAISEQMKLFFGSQFRRRWAEMGFKSNKEFEDKFDEARAALRGETDGGDSTISVNNVPKWKKGSVFPNKESLQIICIVMEVDESYFFPQSHADKYRYDEEYMKNEVGKELLSHAEKLELNLEFVHVIRQLVDFDNTFPLWSPIGLRKTEMFEIMENDGPFKRTDYYAESAPTNGIKDIQVMHEEKTVTLHLNDFDFLKDVQTEVENYIKYLFYKRSLEMDAEVKEVNKIASSGKAITSKELNRIDHYGKYRDKTPVDDKEKAED